MLFPLPEPGLLHLDLFGEPLPKDLLLLLELRVVVLLDLGFTEFAGLHLALPVAFVMTFLGSGNEVEHVGADQKRSKLLEVAVILVLD
jgi:hypothetical protein